MGAPLHTPILLLIYNRPDTTSQVFAAIRAAQPERFYLAADGPRKDRPQDASLCESTRVAAEGIDWPCEVATLFRERNLGCKVAVSSAIDWFFGQVEEGIILEDDCLPHRDFFLYCENLLTRYRHDDRVMHIGGANFQFGMRHSNETYYFSRYPHIWGWASWRRAWRLYDVEMKEWTKEAVKSNVLALFGNRMEKRFWESAWDGVCNGKINTWDFQWAFACLVHNGLAVIPNGNLVSNIGFGEASTHTRKKNRVSSIPLSGLEFPLIHPTVLFPDVQADANTSRLFFRYPRFPRRGMNRLRRLLAKSLD